MKKKPTTLVKAMLVVGFLTLVLLCVMHTEISLHPFTIHIHKAERLMEIFIQICAFLFFYYHGRWEGFKEGSMYVIDTLEKEKEKLNNATDSEQDS